MTFKPKDEFETEDQREAWQKGFHMVIDAKGAPNPVQRWLEEPVPEATAVRIHPLSMDMLYEELEHAPEERHEPMVDGFYTAVMAQR